MFLPVVSRRTQSEQIECKQSSNRGSSIISKQLGHVEGDNCFVIVDFLKANQTNQSNELLSLFRIE
jgi:hypothetical protein